MINKIPIVKVLQNQILCIADFSSALQIKNDTKKRIKKWNKNLTAIKDLVTDIRFKLNTISGDGQLFLSIVSCFSN